MIMDIQKILENGTLTLKVSGRIDTKTSPQFSEALTDSLSGVTMLIVDMGEVAYISSAGLRVLLTAQKTMNKQGEMKVTNVNSDVMEIFDVTGFSDILTIE